MNWSEEGTKFPLTGRDELLQLLRDCISTLWDTNSPPRLLVYLAGIRGIGKTRLLEACKQDLKNQSFLPNLYIISIAGKPFQNFPLPHGNGETPDQSESLEELARWLETVYRQIKVLPHFNAQPGAFKEYHRLVPSLSQNTLQNLEVRARSMAAGLATLCAQEDFYLLFAHDDAPAPMFSWLTRNFYKELLVGRDEMGNTRLARACVITTGYEHPDMPGGSLMRMAVSSTLEPLTPTESRELLEPLGLPPHFENKIVEITAGHPGALADAVNRLKQLPLDGEESEREALKKISQAAAEHLLDKAPPDLARACRLIAPLRRFNGDLLAAVLKPMGGNPFDRWGIGDFMQLGRRLNEQLEFVESRQAYFLHPAVRRILTWALRYADPDSAEFAQVNRIAAAYYSDWLPKTDYYSRFPMLLEEIYHRLVLVELENQSLREQAIRQIVLDNLRFLTRIEYFGRLAQYLSDDQELRNEFGPELEIIKLTLRENLPAGGIKQ